MRAKQPVCHQIFYAFSAREGRNNGIYGIMPSKIDPTPSTYPLHPSDALDHIAQRLISTQAVRDSKGR
jgi:hypothetical protein